jgi:CheY-like chemotaxis protein
MKRALLVEDDSVTRAMIKKMIEGFEYDVTEAVNGKIAWEILCSEESFDVVVTDIMMPDMDGRELLHLMRVDDRFFDLPVVIVSGELDLEMLSRIANEYPEYTRFQQKPVNKADLYNAISSFESV